MKTPSFNIQQVLENDKVRIHPLTENDFEQLYSIASDPLIWEQHPNKDRYKREVFENFFKGALESKGAFLVFDRITDKLIGCSRFYEYSKEHNSIMIGYTFFARDYWGGKHNPSLKKLMLDYVFQFVDKVFFHVGASNVRSQKAMEKLGAKKVRELQVEYYGEPERTNIEYVIEKSEWGKPGAVKKVN